MKLMPRPGIVGLSVYALVVAVSALIAIAVGWPIRNGPLGPWLLVVFFVFAAGTIGVLPMSHQWVHRRHGPEHDDH